MSELSGDSETTLVNHLQAPAGEGFEIGQVVGGKYKIVSLLGRGGIGSVYKVEQILLTQNFALKTLNSQKATDQLIRRFQNEARAAALLNHPNLVKVIDFGLLEGEQPYLVMDLVEGPTLSDFLKKNGPFNLEQAVGCFAQICLGLSYAHDQGIVHRDIKPGNIMLSNNVPFGGEGFVKVVDFGIAKLAYSEGGEVQALTTTGEIFGSPLYMSPEQCSGLAVDHRSDIYSLGCVLFEAMTGTTPFVGQNALTTMMLHQSEAAPTMKEASLGKEFSPELEQIVAKMLAKAPSDRYQNLGVVANDLAQLSKGAPILGIAEAQKKKAEDKDVPLIMSRRELQMWFAVTVLGAGLLGGSAGYFGARWQFDSNTSVLVDDPEAPLAKTVPALKREAEKAHIEAKKAREFVETKTTAIDNYADAVLSPMVDRKVSDFNAKKLPDELKDVGKILQNSQGSDTTEYRECLDRLTVLRKRAKDNPAFAHTNLWLLEAYTAICYRRLEQFPEADQHLKQSMDLCYVPSQFVVIARERQVLGARLWEKKRDAKGAVVQHVLAAKIYENVLSTPGSTRFGAEPLMGIAGNYRACYELSNEPIHDYKAVIEYGNKARPAFEKLNNKVYAASTLMYVGIASARENQPLKARGILEQAEKQLNVPPLSNDAKFFLYSTYKELAAVESKLGDNKRASNLATKGLKVLQDFEPPKGLAQGLETARQQIIDQKKFYDSLYASK